MVPSFVYLLLNCLRKTDVVSRVIDCWGGQWLLGAGGVGGIPEARAGAFVRFHLDVPVGRQLNPSEAPERTVSPRKLPSPSSCVPLHLPC